MVDLEVRVDVEVKVRVLFRAELIFKAFHSLLLKKHNMTAKTISIKNCFHPPFK